MEVTADGKLKGTAECHYQWSLWAPEDFSLWKIWCSVAVSKSGHLLETFIPALVNYFQCTERRSEQQSSLGLSCSSYPLSY